MTNFSTRPPTHEPLHHFWAPSVPPQPVKKNARLEPKKAQAPPDPSAQKISGSAHWRRHLGAPKTFSGPARTTLGAGRVLEVAPAPVCASVTGVLRPLPQGVRELIFHGQRKPINTKRHQRMRCWRRAGTGEGHGLSLLGATLRTVHRVAI